MGRAEKATETKRGWCGYCHLWSVRRVWDEGLGELVLMCVECKREPTDRRLVTVDAGQEDVR